MTKGKTAPQKVPDQAHGLVDNHSVTKPPLAANEVQATVSGRVTDAVSGEPLVGVTVIAEGTQTGTTTDLDGFYELNVRSEERRVGKEDEDMGAVLAR